MDCHILAGDFITKLGEKSEKEKYLSAIDMDIVSKFYILFHVWCLTILLAKIN
jgi:hypothetical protein